ncbi:MAG: hypothetical protein IRZ08_20680, partial [Frankia sp.]|nr:hypothetical protein [Frankia sp.]
MSAMVERHEPWQPAPPARDRAGRVAQRADQAATRALGWLMRLAEQAAAHRSAGAR